MIKKLVMPLLGVGMLVGMLAGCHSVDTSFSPPGGYHYVIDDGNTSQGVDPNLVTGWNLTNSTGVDNRLIGGHTAKRNAYGNYTDWGVFPYNGASAMVVRANFDVPLYARQYDCGWNMNHYWQWAGGQFYGYAFDQSCTLVNADA